jgi:hypothetical protein
MASDSETSDEGSFNGHNDDKGVFDEEPGSETDSVMENTNGEGSMRAREYDEEPRSETDGVMDGADSEGSTRASEGV